MLMQELKRCSIREPSVMAERIESLNMRMSMLADEHRIVSTFLSFFHSTKSKAGS